jgi:hypothetical protein
MPTPVATIIANALAGHNIYLPGESVPPAAAETCRSLLNQIIDAWNADAGASVAEVFTPFNTTPNLQPHTVGPTGVWVLPVRPVAIDAAALALGNGQWAEIAVHDDGAWWNGRTPIAGAPITALYYSADLPNGSIYLDGAPTGISTVRLMTRTVLTAVLLTQSITLAPGGELALTLTLQEAIAEPFHATISPALERRAGQARGKYFKNNLRIPTLSAAGQGAPGMQHDGSWDYRIGGFR